MRSSSRKLLSAILVLLSCRDVQGFSASGKKRSRMDSLSRKSSQEHSSLFYSSQRTSTLPLPLGASRRSRRLDRNVLASSSNTEIGNGDSRGSFTQLDGIERILCLSDLHTDHVDNLAWLRNRMADSDFGTTDLMIVAGDISHEDDTLQESLEIIRNTGAQVFFIAGNHEAWLTAAERQGETSSLKKLDRVNGICRSLGVYTEPLLITGEHALWILPLQGWYDGSLSFSEELCDGFRKWPWVDFIRCDWTNLFPPTPKESPNSRIPIGLVEFFVGRNRENLAGLDLELSSSICTVSHFLPNVQCLPDWADLESPVFLLDKWLEHGAGGMSAKFAKVAGSTLLDEQLRSLSEGGKSKRHLHIFGHSHRPKDFDFQGVRYIHNPLGKPRERQMHMVSPTVDFQLVWETSRGEVAGKQVLRYWDEYGGGKEALWERMEKIRPGRYSRKR